MSEREIENFNDLSEFCDKSIPEMQKWQEIFETQTEEYFKTAKNTDEIWRQLLELKQKASILSFLQELLQRILCESESNCNAMEQLVSELETSLPLNDKNCSDYPHSSVYKSALHLNLSFNSLQEILDAVSRHTKLPSAAPETQNDSTDSCVRLISKQVELLENVERKMFFISNEIQRIENLRNRMLKEQKGEWIE